MKGIVKGILHRKPEAADMDPMHRHVSSDPQICFDLSILNDDGQVLLVVDAEGILTIMTDNIYDEADADYGTPGDLEHVDNPHIGQLSFRIKKG